LKPVLEYYTDKELLNRIPVNETGQPIFNWGETIPGETKEKTFFVKNMRPDKVSLRQPYSTDEDFKIKDYPVHLKGAESSSMTLEFHPSWNRTSPLNADWGFDLVIG